MERDAIYLDSLLKELCKLPSETPWLEFKRNNADPHEIGEYVAALSNSAALEGKSSAFMIWGVDDQSHQVVGTTFDPSKEKKGNEELESWLVRMLSPRLHFKFHKIDHDGKPVVMLEVPRAYGKPTSFSGKEMVRVGSNKKPLKDYSELERSLWRIFVGSLMIESPIGVTLC